MNRLERKSKSARTLALWWLGLAAPNMAFGILGDSMLNLAIGGGLLVGAMGAVVARNIYQGQLAIGGELPAVEAGFADQIAKLQADAEKVAEDEHTQWWRQPGSLWYDTDQFIRGLDIEILKYDTERHRAAATKLAADAKAAETARRKAATEKWLEEQGEWDDFKSDALADARARKERGDWHEPPPGIPGAIRPAAVEPDLSEFRRNIDKAVADAVTAYATPLWVDYSDKAEIHTWGSPNPIRIEPMVDPHHCTRAGKTAYTGTEAHALLRRWRPVGEWGSYPCGDHYHLRRMGR